MSRKILRSRNPLFILFVIIVLAAGTIIISNCNSSPTPDKAGSANFIKSSTTSNYWVVLDITFKPNTSGTIRDSCLNVIKNILMDSVTIMRQGRYPTYNPIFALESYPTMDTLSFKMSVGKSCGSKYPSNITYAMDTTVIDPRCNCNNGCRICTLIVTGSQNGGTGLSTYIASVTTE